MLLSQMVTTSAHPMLPYTVPAADAGAAATSSQASSIDGNAAQRSKAPEINDAELAAERKEVVVPELDVEDPQHRGGIRNSFREHIQNITNYHTNLALLRSLGGDG